MGDKKIKKNVYWVCFDFLFCGVVFFWLLLLFSVFFCYFVLIAFARFVLIFVFMTFFSTTLCVNYKSGKHLSARQRQDVF